MLVGSPSVRSTGSMVRMPRFEFFCVFLTNLFIPLPISYVGSHGSSDPTFQLHPQESTAEPLAPCLSIYIYIYFYIPPPDI